MNKNHTRNQRRMYRIHKQEEKIQAQELIICSLQQRIDKAIDCINNLDKEDINVYQEDKYWAYILYILKGDSNE